MIKKYKIRVFLIFTIFLLVSSYYSLPYYVSKPGMAKELGPLVEVKNSYEQKGTFMLTTVRMGKANIYSYLLAKINKYEEIYPESMVRADHESDEEYNIRQLQMMEGSKLNAIEVAYRKAGLPVEFKYQGVYVLNVYPKMPAEGKLNPGDRIFKVDGRKFLSSDLFIDYVSKKKLGDPLKLTIERENKTKEIRIKVAKFPDQPEKIGVGISLVDDKKIIVKPTVKVNSEEIGGPSAGLMFSLEIYDQLTKVDLTKGYDIAGTGTINEGGIVGPIGGIEQKIVAADQAGADIFFAPNEKGAKHSNYKAALKVAKDIETNMEIVPIDSFNEAVDYLEKLKLKK